MLARFFDLRVGLPPWYLVPAYSEDYAVIKCVRQTLREVGKRQNRNKVALFRDMKQSVFLSENEIGLDDTEKVLKVFWKIEAFLSIYRMEFNLSTSFIPFTDLTDELESIIEKFRAGSDRALLEPIDRLSRKLRRRFTQLFTSAILAIFSLYLVIPSEQLATFWVGILLGGLIISTLVFLISGMTIWHSFPPLLAEHYSVVKKT